MERLRRYIEDPVSHKTLSPIHPVIKVIPKPTKDEKNNDAIMDFFVSMKLNLPNLEMSSLTSTIDQPNQQIGRAVSLDTTIVLTKIESMIPMKSEFE